MDQLKDYADDRLISGCIYCGGFAETRDHVPSRILLDSPLPENLPVVGACWSCNNGFSKDEEYFVCLLECGIVGSTDPDVIRRPTVAKCLRRSPALRARIEAAKVITDGEIRFNVEKDRLKNVLLKLARGHAAFELSQPCRKEPSGIWWSLFPLMTKEQKDYFDASHVVEMIGEVGSRLSQRMFVMQEVLRGKDGEEITRNLLINDWIDVQDGNYRYLAIDEANRLIIRIVIAEYLACEVAWNLDEED